MRYWNRNAQNARKPLLCILSFALALALSLRLRLPCSPCGALPSRTFPFRIPLPAFARACPCPLLPARRVHGYLGGPRGRVLLAGCQVQALCRDGVDLATDTDFLRALHNWVDHTRLTNMHTERQLSAIKRSCGPIPTIERLCAAGMMCQWLSTHVTAGGVDPRGKATTEELQAAGVPLAAASKPSRRSVPSRARGGLTYIRQHIPVGITKQARREHLSRLATEFYSLPADVRSRYAADEAAAAVARGRGSGSAEPVDRYSIELGDKLWNLSSLKEPLRLDAFAAGVSRITAVAEDAAGGMRNYAPRLREEFGKRTFIRNSGQLTGDTVVTAHVPCQIAHPGICRSRMEFDLYEECIFVQRKLEQVLGTFSVGTFVNLRAAHLEELVVVGYIRGGATPVVVVLEAARDAQEFSYVFQRGRLKPLLCSQLAAKLVGTGDLESLIAQPCVVQASLASCHKFSFVEWGKEVDILNAQRPRKRARAALASLGACPPVEGRHNI